MDGAAKPFVGSATTYIRNVRIDVRVGRVGILLEERHRGHDLPGLAVAALRHILGKPSLLHRVLAVVRKPFDGGDAGAIQRPDWYRAGTHRLSADVDGARTAVRDAASEFRSGQADRIRGVSGSRST